MEKRSPLVAGNERTDMTKSKIIGAGGRPGGEAEAITDGKPS
jgi:hypothetical protein